MPIRQPARLSPTPAYGVPELTVANERPCARSGVLALLVLVVGLAVATLWYVALPALHEPPATRSCEVVVLESGSARCVPAPVATSRPTRHTSSSRTTD